MVFGPSGGDHESQNQYYVSLETPGYIKKTKNKNRIIFQNTESCHLEVLLFWENGADKSRTSF